MRDIQKMIDAFSKLDRQWKVSKIENLVKEGGFLKLNQIFEILLNRIKDSNFELELLIWIYREIVNFADNIDIYNAEQKKDVFKKLRSKIENIREEELKEESKDVDSDLDKAIESL